MANKVPLAYADVELQISSAISVGDTSFTLSSSNDDDGNALPAGKYCFTVDNGSSNKEYLLGQLNGTNVTSVVSVSRQGVETVGAVRAHRVGAPAILSDFATIQRVADILRGVETLDGASPISYDAEPTLTDRSEMATVGYVLDNITGGTVAFDNQVITGVNAGETVAAGDLVYFDTADQEWKKTDADTAATVEGVQLAIARGAGTDGATITGGVQVAGVYTTTGLTAGSTYYASDTPGEYTTTAGTTKQAIGYALSTTRLFIIPRNPFNLSTNEKDALAGGGIFGTPSASNKFLTEATSAQVVEFTSSGTWTKDAGLKRVRVQAWGGGSSGAAISSGSSSDYAGGGGGGQYVDLWIEEGDLGATETVTIGAGGAGVVSTGGSTVVGLVGGATTFGSLVSALGGAGGATDNVGADGGYSSQGEGQGGPYYVPNGTTSNTEFLGGQNSVTAGAGGSSNATSGPTNFAAGNSVYGGAGGGAARGSFGNYSNGGTSQLGGNGGNGANAESTNVTASSGSVPGGGGGGAAGDSGFTITSGAGGNGKVIVTEYYV